MSEPLRKPPLDALAAVAAFAVTYLVLDRLSGSGTANSMSAMMNQQPVTDWPSIAINVAVSLTVATAVFFIIRHAQAPTLQPNGQPQARPTAPTARQLRQKALVVIQRGLSSDAKAALKEIQRTGSITQDSLRLRLGWSKAKTSTILTNLDKLNLIQRERMGKTYRVVLSRSFKP